MALKPGVREYMSQSVPRDGGYCNNHYAAAVPHVI